MKSKSIALLLAIFTTVVFINSTQAAELVVENIVKPEDFTITTPNPEIRKVEILPGEHKARIVLTHLFLDAEIKLVKKTSHTCSCIVKGIFNPKEKKWILPSLPIKYPYGPLCNTQVTFSGETIIFAIKDNC